MAVTQTKDRETVGFTEGEGWKSASETWKPVKNEFSGKRFCDSEEFERELKDDRHVEVMLLPQMLIVLIVVGVVIAMRVLLS